MSRRSDEPKIILRVSPRGIFPATGLDAELVGRLARGADLEARPLRQARNKALDAWWLLCSRTADCLDDTATSRSVSNNLLLGMGMVDQESLFGGGVRRVPMSLTDFSEDQLWRLVEAGKLAVQTTVLPGIEIDALMQPRSRK